MQGRFHGCDGQSILYGAWFLCSDIFSLKHHILLCYQQEKASKSFSIFLPILLTRLHKLQPSTPTLPHGLTQEKKLLYSFPFSYSLSICDSVAGDENCPSSRPRVSKPRLARLLSVVCIPGGGTTQGLYFMAVVASPSYTARGFYARTYLLFCFCVLRRLL